MDAQETRSALDAVWLAAAARLGFPVARGGDAYVHWDGRALHIADDPHLDADDTVAQLVLHEICHALTQGPAHLATADWGLDNTTAADNPDHFRELACLRLQAHLLGAYALRDVLYPTTVVKPFYLALGHDALAGGEPTSIPLARAAAERAARAPFGPTLRKALDDSARIAGRARHQSGHPMAADPTLRCGDCAFRSEGGRCRKAGRRLTVATVASACARFESLPDCRDCGACCRAAYDAVFITPKAPVIARHPELIERIDGTIRLRRIDDHCAALIGPSGGPWSCDIYLDRPRTCRDFTRHSRHCLDARRKVGLSL